MKKIVNKILSSYIFLFAFIIGAILTSFFFTKLTEKKMKMEHLQNAKIIASSLNIDRLNTLTASLEDEGKKDYNRIKTQLKYIRKSLKNCKFVYLMRKKEDGKVVFLVDSQDIGTEDYAPPGLEYTEVPAEYMPAFNSKSEITVGPIEDRWGILITSLIPILDPNSNEQIAVLGMDHDASNWTQSLFINVLPTIAAILTLVIAIIILVIIQKNLKKIVSKKTIELYESREGIKATLHSIGDAVIATDTKGIVTNINPIAEKLTGYTSHEAIGKPVSTIFNIINSLNRTIAVNPINKVLETGETVGLANHTALLSKDGNEYQIADSGSPIKNNQGDITGVVLVFRDETQKYLKDKQVKESEEKFRSLAETTSVGILVYTDDKWVYANEATTKLTGYSISELKNMSFWEFVVPEFQQLVKERGAKKQNQEKAISRYEFQIITKYNEIKWVLLEGTSIIFEGKSSGLVSLIDITETKNYEKDLKSSKERYKVLFDQAADGIIICMPNGTIIDANSHIGEITGYRKDELLGNNISMIFPEQELKENPLQYSSVIAGNSVLRQRLIRSKDGELVEIEMNTRTTGEGRLQAYIRDISKRVNLENLRREKEIAQKSNKTKQQFLANMSHDMRTPLTGIIGFTEFLLRSNLSKNQLEYAAYIKESSEYLLNLVNDVLDISAIEEGKMQLNESTFSIMTTIQQQADYYSSKAKDKGVSVSLTIDDNFPEKIISDKNRFRQCLTNLLSNAVKYTHQGTISIVLEKLKQTEQHLVGKISVEDTGIGIDKLKFDQIFEVFSRIDDSNTRQTEGSGLGLAITKRIVELMKGEIGVESKKNIGSKFWFTFSARINTTPLDNLKDESSQKANIACNILLVEDIEVNQRIVDIMLSQEGCTIDIANNGIEALDMFQENKYDIILMDIMMPNMDGITTMKELRKRFTNIPPIIALSAHALEGDSEKYIKEGMDDYVEKPIDRGCLIKTIEKWVTSQE